MTLVEISHTQGRVPVTVFHIQDRIHLGNFSELEKTARQAYEEGARSLVMDLSRSGSLTSIGIRAIVVIHRMFASEGGSRLKLAGATGPTHEMLKVAGITQFLDVYESVEEAVQSF